jgi:hypothetical protein
MTPDDFTKEELRSWFSRRPSLFESDSENRYWRAAFKRFADGWLSGQRAFLDFRWFSTELGYGVWPSALGGYILDRVQS